MTADQPLPGAKLVLRQSAGQAKLSLSMKGVVAAPTPNGSDDPTSVGASLTIYNPTSSESAELEMPASNWTSTGSLWKFRNTAAPNPPSPVRTASIKPARQIKVNARAIGITLDEQTQGSIGAVLTVGTQRYCVLFGGTITRDVPGRFSARKAAAPSACPPLSGTSTTVVVSTSTTSTATSSSSSTITTVTTTSTSTTTVTLADCPAVPDPPVGRAIFTIGVGSASCGDPTLYPNGPSAPFSGEVRDASNVKLADLGLGCLYTGGSFAAVLPPLSIPDGGVSVLEVASVAGTAIELTASEGTGSADCTRGSGPGKHCLNGSLGTDGNGACSTNADCGNPPGSCEEDANCFFGPPIPVPAGAFSTCIINAIRHDICGAADLSTNTTTVSAGLAPRLYVTGDAASPCPQCVAGTCSAGARQGMACSGGVGSKNTTIECPPRPVQYAGRLELVIPALSSGTSTMTHPAGDFCPGQKHLGAFGIVTGDPTFISETGMPLAGSGMIFDTTLAGTFCVPSSGNPIVDANADLPGPGALSATGTMSVCLLPDVCDTLCNPCSLGPLCGVVCAPCLLCLP
jgi:hypothetical protein